MPVNLTRRHLGLAGERCPDCGHPVETLLDNHRQNPLRLCWRCEYERAALDAERQDILAAEMEARR